MVESDAQLARRLQEEENRAARNHAPSAAPDAQLAKRLQEEEDRAARKHAPALAALQKPLSPVDPQWETLDPNPDLHSLFVQFNQVYFWGKLVMCEVKWSPRMTTCAGGTLRKSTKSSIEMFYPSSPPQASAATRPGSATAVSVCPRPSSSYGRGRTWWRPCSTR